MKKFYVYLFLFIFPILFCGTTYAQSEEYIESFDSKIDIREDGTMSVSEAIVYVFPDYRHGIFRTIPLLKPNQDGKQYVLKATNISVKNSLGTTYIFSNNSTKTELNLKIGDPNTTITGRHNYVISYTLSGALTYFSDHDELYWNATGNKWEVPINSASMTITLPRQLSPTDAQGICYTGAQGSTTSFCTTSFDGKSLEVTTTDYLYQGEGLTAAISFPKGEVNVLEPEELKKSVLEIITEYLFILGSILYYLVAPLLVIFFAYKRKKKQPEEKRVVAAWFDPPKTQSGREITSGEVGILYDRKGDIRDITASLIQLAEKGFIKIKTEEIGMIFKKQDFSLELLKDANSSDLQEYETDLLDAIFTSSSKSEVRVSELGKRVGFSGKIQKVYKQISAKLHEENFYETDPLKTRENWMMLLIPAIFIFNPLLIIAAFYASGSAKRTKLGAEAWAVIESMKNFVKSQQNQLEFQAKNQMFFEKLLPYAITLGIERVWVERFKDINLSPPEWLESTNFSTMSYLYMMDGFNSSFSSAVAISSSRSSTGHSSGFSGGFSGGGGGGGGGGSW